MIFEVITAPNMMDVFWDVAPCSLVEVYRRLRGIALMMEAQSTSETSVTFYQSTRRNVPEDITSFSFQGTVFSSSYAFRTQEWFNLSGAMSRACATLRP
jgi:hypothetical protein